MTSNEYFNSNRTCIIHKHEQFRLIMILGSVRRDITGFWSQYYWSSQNQRKFLEIFEFLGKGLRYDINHPLIMSCSSSSSVRPLVSGKNFQTTTNCTIIMRQKNK